MNLSKAAGAPRTNRLSTSAPVKSFRLHWQLYLLLLLPLAWVLIFRYWPMFGLQIAFKNFKISKGFWNSSWVGLKYFEQFFTDYSFKRLITNTLGISIYSLVAGFFPPIILAVALNECKRLAMSPWRRHTEPLEEYAGTLTWETPEQSALFQAVMDLPRKYRVPLYLYYYEGYAVSEISAMLGRNPSTVQTHLARGREQLKHLFKEEWSDV